MAFEAQQIGDLFDGVLDDPQSFEASFQMNRNAGNPSIVGGLSLSGGSANFGGSSGNPFMSTSSTEMIVAGGIAALSVALYVAGLILIVRRRSSMIARPRAGV